MENQSSSMTPEDSIKIISDMINKTREDLSDNSFYFLLWGYVVSLACITHFITIRLLLNFGLQHQISLYSGLLWGTFIMAGILIQYIKIARKGNFKRVKTYAGEFMAVNWQVNGALIILIGIFCYKFNIHPSPFILAICGAATFVSGVIIRHKAFITGSLFMFLFSIACLFINSDYQLLITATAVIIGYLIPGYSLKKSK